MLVFRALLVFFSMTKLERKFHGTFAQRSFSEVTRFRNKVMQNAVQKS